MFTGFKNFVITRGKTVITYFDVDQSRLVTRTWKDRNAALSWVDEELSKRNVIEVQVKSYINLTKQGDMV